MSQTSIEVYSEMGLLKLPLLVLLFSVFSLLSFIALCDHSELTVKFLKTPLAFSNLNSAIFVFEVLAGGSGACTNCNITCKLDDGFGRINASQCEDGTVLCEGLQDGNHKFEICPNGTQGVGCSSYYWTVDTVPPTANISASTPFTNALNVSINISFSEPCTGGGGFACSSVNACNLLVYDAGQVIPTSLKTLQPNLQYSVLVGLSSTAQSGRVILVMDKKFCTDSAGNKFERNKNSSFTLHFDRRSVILTTHVPKRQLQFNGETILVRATNNYEKLRVCLTFPEPVLNTSEEIKNSLKAEILLSLPMSQGSLLPLVDTKKHEGPRRFEYKGIACHLQVIALSGWLAVRLPVEYYELTRGLRWSIPYLSLPWERETGRTRLPANTNMSKIHYSGIIRKKQPVDQERNGLSKLPALLASGLKTLVEAPLPNSTSVSKLNFNLDRRTPDRNCTLDLRNSTAQLNCISDYGWNNFGKNMIWLAIIVGSFISVHALLLLILKWKNKNSAKQKDYGVLTFPRFEMVIVNLSLPCICQASAAIIRGGTASGIAVGVLLLGVVAFLLLALLWFLYKGITCAQLLEYEEDQEGQGFHWYQKIVRVFLVPVEKVNWTPKKTNVTILESLYEDYRGPPKSKLSQNAGGSSHTQGAESPFIQKLFGKLRIYYTLLESVIQKLCGELRIYYPLLESMRRVLIAIMAGLYEDDKSFSKIPTTFSLCINCFHLFFLVLEKPFIKKNIQLLEIMAVSSETCISAIMFVLGGKKLSAKDEMELSAKDEKKFGILMLILVLVGILPQIMNELYALYKQIKQLDFDKHSFLTGLKTASSGLTSLFSSKEFSIRRPPALKDTATYTSTSYQFQTPNQD
ncbi:hypothetical protein CMV_003221 [Castanea mollissima]|uniref:Uncharacterized protein n=1 Tax=Castanea mollissima TaxID=60419 RepID=A0A8J4VVE1_9ROSI|nr:hypothetical protein CMV_003221 [Castanea mollissima]